ncbi:MAG: HD domain-containing protein [Promethearchaeota archaeon]
MTDIAESSKIEERIHITGKGYITKTNFLIFKKLIEKWHGKLIKEVDLIEYLKMTTKIGFTSKIYNGSLFKADELFFFMLIRNSATRREIKTEFGKKNHAIYDVITKNLKTFLIEENEQVKLNISYLKDKLEPKEIDMLLKLNATIMSSRLCFTFDELQRKIEVDIKNEHNIGKKNLFLSGYFLIESLKNNNKKKIRYLIENDIGKKFELTLYQIGKRRKKQFANIYSRFMETISSILKIKRLNIINLIDAGLIRLLKPSTWEKIHDVESFQITDDFDCATIFLYTISQNEQTISLKDYIDEGFKDLNDEKKIDFFEDFIKQLTDLLDTALSLEVKLYNIIVQTNTIYYSPLNNKFIITDFKIFKSSRSSNYDELKRELGAEKSNQIRVIREFNQINRKIFENIQSLYQDSNSEIRSLLDKFENIEEIKSLNSVLMYYHKIKPYLLRDQGWTLKIKMNEYMTPTYFGKFDSILRIPVSNSVYLTQEVRNIIDCPQFKRLRGVAQLGPTSFVFPGANHTRFEHSLGTYQLSLLYLERLLQIPEFKTKLTDERGEFSDSIKYFILTGLLHDIGHYPYSHWIEEMDFPDEKYGSWKFKSHEKRGAEILKSNELKDILTNKWKIDVNILGQCIADNYLRDDISVFQSLINSIIDVDHVDYLRRDSIHCGVPYGNGYDVDRIIDSLYFDKTQGKIIVTEKGISNLKAILNCRNTMYVSVYWHKTVRACEAMFKRVIYELVINGNLKERIEKWFDLPDQQFLEKIYSYIDSKQVKHNRKEKRKLKELVDPFTLKSKERGIYKTIYEFGFGNIVSGHGFGNFRHFIKEHVHKDQSKLYQSLIKLSNLFVYKLREFKDFKDMQIYDIIFETTPIKEKMVTSQADDDEDEYQIYHTKEKRYIPLPDDISKQNSYLKDYQRTYIFCSPQFAEDLRNFLIDRNKDFSQILQDVIDLYLKDEN